MIVSVILPVLFDTEESENYELVNDEDAPIELMELKNVYFYDIATAYQYEKTKLSIVVSDGILYIVNLPIFRLTKFIKSESMTFRNLN